MPTCGGEGGGLVLPLLPLDARLGWLPGLGRVLLACRAFLPGDDLRGVVACVHDAVAAKVLPEASRKGLRTDVVSREVPEGPRELRLVRDVGHGLPSAKAPYGRRFADGGYERRRVRVVSHRLEDVRLEQADAAVRRTAVAAPAVFCEHRVVDEKFACLRESFQVFPQLPDVVHDAGDEVCLYGVPVPAEPVHRRIFRVLDAFSCFHVDITTNNRTEINGNVK